MPIIHLIRHGETATNGQCYAGRQDVPLTARGHHQALGIVTEMKKVPLAAVFSSPLRRARDTARPLASDAGLDLRISADLVELDFGDLEGKSKTETVLSLRKRHLHDPIPGGEALADLWIRTGRFHELLRQYPETCQIAVVGHYWSNRLLLGHLENRTIAEAAKTRTYRPATGSRRVIAAS
jgi:probable phosphoglycerate mutase